ncbi:MAG TPA: hypothetical protein VM680_19115 [Verrucomicrobiae bacterium]|nr:hypothetical protein [Verrucomicrobiae bacterium]
MRTGKAFAAGVTLFALAVSAQVRAANYALFTTVGEVNTQTSEAGPGFADQYRFSIRSVGAQPGDIWLERPNGSLAFPNPFSPGQNIFASREELAAQFPSGTYKAQLSYRQTPISQPTTQTLTADATVATSFPPAPRIINGTWEDGVLMAEQNQLTLEMAPWAGRPTGSFIGYTLGFSTKTFLNSDPATIVFSGLQPGATYTLDIMYMNPESSVSMNLPGSGGISTNMFGFVMGGSSITRVTAQTVPEPSVWQLGVASVGAWVILRRRGRRFAD